MNTYPEMVDKIKDFLKMQVSCEISQCTLIYIEELEASRDSRSAVPSEEVASLQSDYKEAIKEIGSLQRELKEAEQEIRDLNNELRQR